ncbi:Hypothetical_protein [Hexamita inflata]|uniref:Hypothetical_protein n=1 Tax=Hexamita inflata TaxID=28002 RepID=A0AA86N5K2_9EUKA|nr:Hypothetical protein HINF_LOCUS833 [Hexamita inflata]
MPTQQRPNRALTELLADQFHLIRQLTFQKLVLASQFLFARYFLRLAREVVLLYWHCLIMVAFDALIHQLEQVPRSLFSLFVFANSQFRGILPWMDQLFPRVFLLSYFQGFGRVDILFSSLLFDKLQWWALEMLF